MVAQKAVGPGKQDGWVSPVWKHAVGPRWVGWEDMGGIRWAIEVGQKPNFSLIARSNQWGFLWWAPLLVARANRWNDWVLTVQKRENDWIRDPQEIGNFLYLKKRKEIGNFLIIRNGESACFFFFFSFLVLEWWNFEGFCIESESDGFFFFLSNCLIFFHVEILTNINSSMRKKILPELF